LMVLPYDRATQPPDDPAAGLEKLKTFVNRRADPGWLAFVLA